MRQITGQGLLLIALAAASSTIGNLLLKLSRSKSSFGLPSYLSPWLAAAICFYVLNLLLFAKALDRIPVSVGYPILATTGFAMLTITAATLLGERFSLIQGVGLALAIGGVACLARGG
jgi:multidrug transporter EmrE-like cation transporter